MRIILDIDRSSITDHAKRLIIASEKYQDSTPNEMIPKGIAVHTAQYPIHCDDCGNTYWSKDKWASHLGCSGYSKKKVGFQTDT